MLSQKQITRSLFLLLPLIAMASGCQSLVSPLKFKTDVKAPIRDRGSLASATGISMKLGDTGFSSIVNPDLDSDAGTLNDADTRGMPAAVKKHLNSARQLELAGQYQEAIPKFEWLIQNGFDSPMVCHRLAVLYDKTGQINRSLPLYQKAVDQDPDNSELLCDIGYRCAIDGDLEKAAQYYELALSHSPNLDRAHNNLAVVLARFDRPDLAMQHFLEAGCSQQQAQYNVAQMTNAAESPQPR